MIFTYICIGLIGLLAAKHFPERVSGLVLINSGIPKTSDILPPHIRKGYEKELELLSQNSGDIASYVQQWEKSQNVASLSNDTKEQLSFDFKKEKDTTNLKPRTNIALAKHDMDRIAKDSLRLDQMFNSTYQSNVVTLKKYDIQWHLYDHSKGLHPMHHRLLTANLQANWKRH